MQIYQLNSQTNLTKPSQTDHPRESLDLQQPYSPQRECRICLSHDVQSLNLFLSPCKCSGSIKYVHQSCLKNWIQLKLLEISEEENCEKKVTCELFRTKIPFKIELRSECRKLHQIKEEIEVKNQQFTINLICIIISVCLIAFSIYKLSNIANHDYGDNQSTVKIVFLSIMVVSILAFIYSIYCLRDFVIKKKAQLFLRQDNHIHFGQIQ